MRAALGTARDTRPFDPGEPAAGTGSIFLLSLTTGLQARRCLKGMHAWLFNASI